MLSPIFVNFFILTFLGGILSLRFVCIFEINIEFSIFLILLMAYFKEKKYHFSEGTFFKFFDRRTKKIIENPQNKEKCLFYKNLIPSFANPKLMKDINFQKFCQNIWTLIQIRILMSQWQTKDSDPDPCQNVPDPEDWLPHCAAAARQNLYNL